LWALHASKGQIVLPAEFRRMDGVEPGQEFGVERNREGNADRE
jgi:bifunctional DNA-binding transcriptional regulator/antitoxin component of YhaV-PrlF toxin-antitoxin module